MNDDFYKQFRDARRKEQDLKTPDGQIAHAIIERWVKRPRGLEQRAPGYASPELFQADGGETVPEALKKFM